MTLEQRLELASIEIVRLRAEVHEANAACDTQVRECNRLRAENAELTKAIQEYACTGTETPCGCQLIFTNLRAENADLREHLVKSSEDMGRICLENERLREAVESVHRYWHDFTGGVHRNWDDVNEKVCAALARPPDPPKEDPCQPQD